MSLVNNFYFGRKRAFFTTICIFFTNIRHKQNGLICKNLLELAIHCVAPGEIENNDRDIK